MAKLTNQIQPNIKRYVTITTGAQKKILAITQQLKIDNLVFEHHNTWQMIFYDTPDDLLTKTGILLYRTIENNEHFLKMEKLNFLPSVSKLRKNEMFELPIAPRDTPKNQAFYLINGIQAMFSTRFTIDLENVIKAVIPKLQIDIKGTAYKGFRGDGFKCLVEFQKSKYTNFATKRKVTVKECTLFNISEKNFDADFIDFWKTLEKYCKDVVPQNESRHDYGRRITQAIKREVKENKKERKKKEKEKEKIQG